MSLPQMKIPVRRKVCDRLLLLLLLPRRRSHSPGSGGGGGAVAAERAPGIAARSLGGTSKAPGCPYRCLRE